MYKELFTYSYVICKHRINVTKGLCSDVSLPGIEQPSSFIYLLKQQQQKKKQTNSFVKYVTEEAMKLRYSRSSNQEL